MTDTTEPTKDQAPARPVDADKLYHRGEWVSVRTGDAETVIVGYCTGRDFGKNRRVPRAEIVCGEWTSIDEAIAREHGKLGFLNLVVSFWEEEKGMRPLLLAGFLMKEDALAFAQKEGRRNVRVLTPHEYLTAACEAWMAVQDEAIAEQEAERARIAAVAEPIADEIKARSQAHNAWIDQGSDGRSFAAVVWADLPLEQITSRRSRAQVFTRKCATLDQAAAALMEFRDTLPPRNADDDAMGMTWWNAMLPHEREAALLHAEQQLGHAAGPDDAWRVFRVVMPTERLVAA